MCSLGSCLFTTITPLRGSASFVLIFLLLYQVSGFVCGGGAVPAWAILCKLAQMRALWGPLTPHFPRHTIVHYSIPIAVLTGIEIMFLWPHHRQRALWKSTQKGFLEIDWQPGIWKEIRLIGWLVLRASKLLQSKGCDTSPLLFLPSKTLCQKLAILAFLKMETCPSYIGKTIMGWLEWDNRDGGNPIRENKLLHFSGVTVLLSLTVFQESVSQFMPITSLQIPLLGNTTKMLILPFQL